jgi:hypothetical protein
MEGSGHDLICDRLYYPSIFLEGLRKTMNDLGQIAGLWAEILTQDPQNMKQEC